MLCPKCQKEISDLVIECPYCHTSIRMSDKKKKKLAEKQRRRLADNRRKKDKTIKVKALPEDGGKKRKASQLNVKLLIGVGIAVVVIIIAVVIVLALTASKGERYADDASNYIGEPVQKLSQQTGLHYADESKYYGINSAVVFDYVYECEQTVKAQGIEYPRWAVFITQSKMGDHISEVTYTDFTVIKKDMRGKKRKGVIDLDRFSAGTKQSAVLKEIDMSPYSITYSEDGGVTYLYKYYYPRDNGDEQAMLTRVTFSDKGKYKYSASEVLIPRNM